MLKKIFLFLFFINFINRIEAAAPPTTAQDGNPHTGSQWGRITIHNTHTEPIVWRFTTVLNATDFHPLLDNQRRTYSDTLQPGNRKVLSTGISVGNNILYGTTVELYVQKKTKINLPSCNLTLTGVIGHQTIDLKKLLENFENSLKHKIQ